MKPIIKRRPTNRLAKLVRMPGGRSVGAIELDVEARMEALKDACLLVLQDKVQEIVGMAAKAARPPGGDDLGRLYGLCKEVLGLAGVAQLEDAGRAAMSFCRLLDGWRGPPLRSTCIWRRCSCCPSRTPISTRPPAIT